ncbi:hypothetical protein CHELA40_15108 [Chelatococcus asaccharovorans]|nr:hypothetical protein CHELA17_60512 [Chelatococcus asaccharovorans]CAH1681526.1 hypothetical protein CHELA40_15108 [Chelatococcus asaccharovorans]
MNSRWRSSRPAGSHAPCEADRDRSRRTCASAGVRLTTSVRGLGEKTSHKKRPRREAGFYEGLDKRIVSWSDNTGAVTKFPEAPPKLQQLFVPGGHLS